MQKDNRERRYGWLHCLVLGASIELALAAFPASAAEPLRVAPGESLAATLGLDGGSYWICVDGGLPRPLDQDARLEPGEHRVLLLQQHGDALVDVGWRRLRVDGEAGAASAAPGRLTVDRRPPRATFYATGPHLEQGETLRVAPDAGLRIRFSDLSGIASWQARDRHPGSSAAGRWLPGRHHLSVHASDAAGNHGLAGELEFEVDGEPPLITWRIVENGLTGASGEPIYSAPVTLEVGATDASGVAGIEAWLDGGWRRVAGSRLTVAEDSLALRASDRLGNSGTAEARWSYDREGPEISLVADPGEVRDDGVVVLPVNGVLRVTVSDAGAGAAEAKYRYNRTRYRPLPQQIRVLSRGRFRLEIQARDRLGNETVRQWKVRAVGRSRGRGGRR